MRTRATIALALTAALGGAACGSGSDTGDAVEVTTTDATSAADESTTTAGATDTTAPSTTSATVDAGETALGTVLVDSEGFTLYAYTADSDGTSACNEGCSTLWPPLATVDAPVAGGDVTAELATITRDDGTTQVTINGHPAYGFASDSAVGDTAGHGVGGVWFAFGPDGELLPA